MRVLRRHSIPILALTAAAGWWVWPILRRFGSAIPGVEAGDNISFLWNVWWMRYVLHHPGHSFFSTPFLFYPFGVDLTLHTHTALPALAAALAGPASIIASQNLLVVTHLWLNFICAYALAYGVAGQVPAALVAALVFGSSPFVAAHLTGHFNLIAAWVIPLACLLARRASERGSIGRGAVLGAALGATAYVDYYLAIFAGLLVGIGWLGRCSTIALRAPRGSKLRRPVLACLAVLLAFDALLIVWILASQVDTIAVGSFRVSVRGVGNSVTFAWLLITAGAAAVLLPRVSVTFSPLTAWATRRAVAATITVTLVLLGPLIVNGVKLWREGQYVSQQYRWRSAPGGVDTATLVLGNPFNRWWGGSVRGLYSRLRLDSIEGCGFIPASALLLAAITIAARRKDPVVWEWTFAGAVFLIWALGPWLLVLGRQTPLMLPAIGLRFVPVIGNARIPGRAMVVVYLAVAMLAAIGVASLAKQRLRGNVLAWCLVFAVAVECAPVAASVYGLQVPSLYARLNDASLPGAVCELPLGLRDGLSETGAFDSTALFAQTIHERPILGGFVARLSPEIVRRYQAAPVVGSLLRLSGGGPLSAEDTQMDAAGAAAHLASVGVVFVVLDTRRAPPDLIRYVRSSIALNRIGEEDGRIFFRVVSAHAPRDGASDRPSGRPAQAAEKLED
jgi:hypothetical protein